MSKIFTEFYDFYKKAEIPFLIVMGIVLSVILFLPEQPAKILGVDEFRSEYRKFLGPVLILITAFCAAKILIGVFKKVKSYFENKRMMKQRCRQLHKLTPEEKEYLSDFILQKKTSIYVDITDGVVSSLCNKKVIYQASRVGEYLKFAFNLNEWAREYLTENPDLLK